MGIGAAIMILIFHLILYGLWETFLSSDADLFLFKLTVSDIIFYLLIHIFLLARRWGLIG